MTNSKFNYLGYEIEIWPRYKNDQSIAIASHLVRDVIIKKSFKTDKVESIFRAMKHEVDYMERIKD
jgi:hypothetical protein